MELVAKLFSAFAMKVPKCVPWCGTTPKWYDLLISRSLLFVTVVCVFASMSSDFQTVYVKALEPA